MKAERLGDEPRLLLASVSIAELDPRRDQRTRSTNGIHTMCDVQPTTPPAADAEEAFRRAAANVTEKPVTVRYVPTTWRKTKIHSRPMADKSEIPTTHTAPPF